MARQLSAADPVTELRRAAQPLSGAEDDWPDAYRVNRYVQGATDDADAEEALRGFCRFPTWMWRNAEVLDFVGWLRDRNERHPDSPAGFYGLDLYSLFASVAEVVAYLERVDPAAARG